MMKIRLRVSDFGLDEINASIDVLRSGQVTMGELGLTYFGRQTHSLNFGERVDSSLVIK